MSISVVGLGKLGAPMIAVFAERGFDVIGYDTNIENVDLVNQSIAPVKEPFLQKMMLENKGRISATTDIFEAVNKSDISFIIVPSPSKSDSFFSNSYILDAIKKIGAALKGKESYHLVVITSTVMPGSMDTVIKKSLEEHSEKKIGLEIGLCYNPEFIALGTVIKDMLNPDILLIGESDLEAGNLLEKIYEKVAKTKPKIHRMNFINAEIAKISVNSFVTTKISYANMLAEICETLPGGDVDVVTNAIGDDTRIGRKYLRGGTAFGGPCFPRDNKAMAALGKTISVNTSLTEVTDNTNDHQAKRLKNIITSRLNPPKTVLLLGVSYKPNTPVYEESQAIKLAHLLDKSGIKVFLSDPEVSMTNNSKFCFERNYSTLIRKVEMVVVMTPWEEYIDIGKDLRETDCMTQAIVDPWRLLNITAIPTQVEYIAPGRLNGNTEWPIKLSSKL